MNTLLWPKVEEALTNRFKIKAFIDLFDCDLNPAVIDSYLKPLEGHVFAPDERIIITNIDTQCYLPHSKYSVTLYNLHLAISHYDIPSEFIIMMSNQYGIENELALLARTFRIAPIKSFASLYNIVIAATPAQYRPIEINAANISHLLCCINGGQRSNRVLLVSMLKAYDLWDNNITTINFAQTNDNVDTDGVESVIPTSHLNYVLLNQPTRIYDPVLALTDNHSAILKKYSGEIYDTTVSHELVYGAPNDNQTRWQPSFLQRSLIYLVSETVGDYPYPFISEKTVKGILSKRPVIIASSKNSLAVLRDLGFKTFGDFWDESYDSEEYYYQRLDKIIGILTDFSKLNISELQSICLQMENVLDYNFNHYLHNFCNTDLNQFLREVTKG